MSAMLPERPTLAGDWNDDDGQVFADLVEPQNEPLPPPADAMVAPISDRPARPGRLLTGTLAVDPAWTAPTLLLPADPLRQSVTIQNNSGTATDGLRVADDPGKLMTATACGSVFPANTLTLDRYTGAVWVSAADAAAAVPCSYWGVTS
jgi:hypothetical protein